ncbi:hypothetical protein OOU_Y34scaffold00255g78 [Pyricularia oryzae Y34]|uniref:Uncharacterized protein n=2 Tax=Pyricularia oryzae TaxID=318829 RepID=A0AA97P4B2_PYRO3|nr:hypothetical protein OOU_Y34scaffold00255g78 [Pyricularia oryzae Y34]
MDRGMERQIDEATEYRWAMKKNRDLYMIFSIIAHGVAVQ